MFASRYQIAFIVLFATICLCNGAPKQNYMSKIRRVDSSEEHDQASLNSFQNQPLRTADDNQSRQELAPIMSLNLNENRSSEQRQEQDSRTEWTSEPRQRNQWPHESSERNDAARKAFSDISHRHTDEQQHHIHHADKLRRQPLMEPFDQPMQPEWNANRQIMFNSAKNRKAMHISSDDALMGQYNHGQLSASHGPNGRMIQSEIRSRNEKPVVEDNDEMPNKIYKS